MIRMSGECQSKVQCCSTCKSPYVLKLLVNMSVIVLDPEYLKALYDHKSCTGVQGCS